MNWKLLLNYASITYLLFFVIIFREIHKKIIWWIPFMLGFTFIWDSIHLRFTCTHQLTSVIINSWSNVFTNILTHFLSFQICWSQSQIIYHFIHKYLSMYFWVISTLVLKHSYGINHINVLMIMSYLISSNIWSITDICCCSADKLCPTLCDCVRLFVTPVNCSRHASLSHCLPDFA